MMFTSCQAFRSHINADRWEQEKRITIILRPNSLGKSWMGSYIHQATMSDPSLFHAGQSLTVEFLKIADAGAGQKLYWNFMTDTFRPYEAFKRACGSSA